MNRTEWGSCIVVGSTVLIWGAILKLLPEKWFSKLNTSKLVNEDEKTESAIVKKMNETKKPVTVQEPAEVNEENDVGDEDDNFDRA
jgi:hypothetical protein